MYKIVITDRGYDAELETILSIERAMAEFGGECIISLDPEDAANCDGIILPGAPPDVDPALYGEENTGCGEIDREMDDKRLAMVNAAVKAGKPVMGICAGCQIINVYFGGTLVQDLEMGEPHKFNMHDFRYHPVINLKETPFHMIYGDSGIINSLHHQAIKRLGNGLIAGQIWLSDTLSQEQKNEWLWKAENLEGVEFTGPCVLEGFVHKTLPVFGTQWHPELMYKAPIPGTINQDKIFEYFAYLIRRTYRLREAESRK